jgi:hypothetical protein
MKRVSFIVWLTIVCSTQHIAFAQPLSAAEEAAFHQRATLLLQYVANYYPKGRPGYPPGHDGKLSDFGKYNYPLFIAWLQQAATDAEKMHIFESRMQQYATMPTFHFNLVGLPRILYGYAAHPVVAATEKAFLQRVWEKSDGYNAFTAEGTENHISMSKTSAYLYAQLALEKYPADFPAARQRLDSMRQWVMDWSKKIYYTGTGEFNSAIYYAYTIIGWINLYDFAHDAKVKAAARAVLDYYAAEMALHIEQVLPGGSDMRGQGIVQSFMGSYAYLAWLWYGDSPAEPLTASNLDMGRSTNEIIQTVHAATSTYRPPAAAIALARKQVALPASYIGSKPAYLLNQPSLIRQTLYLDSSFSLGAGYFAYKGWGSGNNQIVSWKYISRVAPGPGKSAQYAGGIGLASPHDKQHLGGSKRSPFDQIVQHNNVLIHLTRLPANAAQLAADMRQRYDDWHLRWQQDFAQRFPGDNKVNGRIIKFQEIQLDTNRTFFTWSAHGSMQWWIKGGVLLIGMEQSWLAVRPVGAATMGIPRYSTDSSMLLSAVVAPVDSLCGFVMEATPKNRYATPMEFEQAVLQQSRVLFPNNQQPLLMAYGSLGGTAIKVQYNSKGSFTEPMFDFGYGVTQPTHLPQAPPFAMPQWPRGEGHSTLATWWVNGKKIALRGQWPVYRGPHLRVEKGKLHLTDGSLTYEVDYRGQLPVFK